MDKAKINNEIILMRKDVGQARGLLIKKLTRDISKLRHKKGTEAQKQKNRRKRKRLIAEILEIKKIKKDEITKLVLQNTLTLEEVLCNQESKPLTRMIARIGNHKNFKTRVSEFRSKYPNYMNFLAPGRRAQAKLKGKSKLEIGNEEHSNVKEEVSKPEELGHTMACKESEDNVESDNDLNVNSSCRSLESNDESEIDSKDKSVKESDCENENATEEPVEDKVIEAQPKSALVEKPKLIEDNGVITSESVDEVAKKKTYIPRAVTKEGIVKWFDDLLQADDDATNSDKNTEINTELVNEVQETSNVKKEVDSFFLMDDGETDYLTLVPSTNNLAAGKHNSNSNNNNNNYNNYNNDDNNDYSYKSNSRRQRFQQDNNHFSGNKFRNNDFKFNLDRSNEKSDYQYRKARPYEQENRGYKRDFKRFNNDYQDHSNSYKRYSKSNFEDKNDRPIHPSWEAKRKQQEILKQGFQGKKIVFSDV